MGGRYLLRGRDQSPLGLSHKGKWAGACTDLSSIRRHGSDEQHRSNGWHGSDGSDGSDGRHESDGRHGISDRSDSALPKIRWVSVIYILLSTRTYK